MKKEITNIKASIRARLQNKSNDTNRPFGRFCNIMELRDFSIVSVNQNTRISLF